MGNIFTSGNRAKEVAELERRVSLITKYLDEHKGSVIGLAHTVETQATSFQILLSKIGKIVSVKEMDTSEKKIDDSEQIICCHCTKDWQEYANKLFGSVQSSLYYQSNSLRSTFKRLNQAIREIKEHYKFADGTSVDRVSIDYIDSPTMNYEDEYHKLKAKLKSLQQLNDNLKIEYDRQLKDMKQREEKLKFEKEEQSVQMQNEKKCLETNLDDMQEKLKGQDEKIKDMTETLKGQEDKIRDMEEKCKYQEENIHDIQNELKGLKLEKTSLEQDMKDLKQTITVQLFHNLKGGMIPNLLCELKKMLATQMQMKRQELQFVICQTETDVNPRIPVFVFCINASRLGTDAASAIQNLKVSSKVSILVFHHKDVHALPNQASDRVLTEPEFKELGGIFDIAFLADKGIYACDMNRATAVGIEKFLITQSQVMTLSR